MTLYGRSSSWAAALALSLAGLIVGGAAAVQAAAPARAAASAFELTLTLEDTLTADGDVLLDVHRQGTFTSQALFCPTGTLDEVPVGLTGVAWRFRCDDGTGSVTVSFGQWYGNPWSTTWRILEGSGSYAGLRGRGSLRGELLSKEGTDSWSVAISRIDFQGVVDRDSVAPTIAIPSATATKLGRHAGAYALKVGTTLRDNNADNPVSYTLRAYAGGVELARRFGTTTTGAVSMTLRIRPPAEARIVRLALTGMDPVGNATSVRRAARLPR